MKINKICQVAAVIALELSALYAGYRGISKEPELKPRVIVETLPLKEEVEETCVTLMTDKDIEEEMFYDSLELVAICVEAEAGNQSILGKRMVADVILNRVDDPDYPNSVEEVIKQRYQFSSYWDGRMEKIIPSEESYEAVRMELSERSYPEILFFTAGKYSVYGTPYCQVEDHYFSTK